MSVEAPVLPQTDADFVALRRHLHSNPELAYQEHQTSALVARYLREWGFSVETGIGGTGVVGTLVGGSGDRTIGIRADMDALPIEEATGLPYASRNPGTMHACGHDGHTTILLAAAKALAETRRFCGTVRLIFQPAEEIGGGARTMIKDGLFERFPVDAVFGLHNWPGVEKGQFAFLSGPAMASVDMAIIKVRGRGGHGAKPHLAVDPVVAASSLVLALQTVVSRHVDPLQASVLTVGSIHGGTLPNVIPDEVELQLTVRAFDAGVRQSIRDRITALVPAHVASYGAEAELYYPVGYPVVVNDASQTEFARETARRHFGAARIDGGLKPITASEDFAFMLEQKPGSYLFLGNGNSADLHNSKYDFNDDLIAEGARYWVHLAEDFLSANAPRN
jgi:hippurate hydrolase